MTSSVYSCAFIIRIHDTVTRPFQLYHGSSGGVVVKLLACGAEGRGSIPGLAATISEIGYLLLPCRDMAERSLKRRKIFKTTQPNKIQLYHNLTLDIV